MDVPEIIPVPITPEVRKNLTPAAVKRSEPPFHDPERQDSDEERRSKKRRGGRDSPCDVPAETDPDAGPDGGARRGTRVDIHV
ncbi:MAG: hypothetical protein GY944_02450 [bacterium]|nr:hypothetical protein [bacterium]